MKKRQKLLSLFLCSSLVLSNCSQIVYAQEIREDGLSIETEGLCPHHTEHDGNCGYTEETPCTFTCEKCDGEKTDEGVGVQEENLGEVNSQEETVEKELTGEGTAEEVNKEDKTEEISTESIDASDDQTSEEKEEEALFVQELAVGGSVTVSTPDQFERALNNSSVNEIIVSKRITLSGTEENEDYGISPVMIRGDVTIKGNGSGILTLRSPIQITGDNVKFQDIEMNFISSGALGSVPHREIFLAGHKLTLDNVNCYTKGADGSLGGFGGNEAELLPTVYAGGYEKTTVQNNGASLTVVNSNDKTNIQAIYAGHDEGKDKKVPYTGTMDINIDSKAVVRDGIFASANQAAVNITVTGQNLSSCRTRYFEGNDKTTITFDGISANRIAVNGGNVVLKNGAVFEPIVKGQAVIDNIEVPDKTVLNLASMPGTVINGNFKGGGMLILDKDDSMTIKGEISGDTTFKTWGGALGLKGELNNGKAYITSSSKKIDGSIKLDSDYDDKIYSLELDKSKGAWIAKNNTPVENRELGSFEVLSSPQFVDYKAVENESLDSKIEPSNIIVTEAKDKNGDVYVPELFPTVLRAEDVDSPDEQNWGTDIFVQDLGNWNGGTYDFEGKYYISFGTNNGQVSAKIKPGNYVVFFTKEEHFDGTVRDVIADAVGRSEFTIYKNAGQATAEIKAEHVSAVPDQKYTGKEITPKVQIVVDGKTLTEGKDYVVKYVNNINVTSDASKARIIIDGIGDYNGSVETSFKIVKAEAETQSAVSAEKQAYTYGEVAKITFTAQPKKDGKKGRKARSAGANKVDFYYGSELLGSADVENGKAILFYDTTKQVIPVGGADITVDFGGNSQLEAANFTKSDVFTLKKRVLELQDISSISLKDFVYEANKNVTEITGINWNDSLIQELTFDGTASISSDAAGTYTQANIKEISLTKGWENWYDATNLNAQGPQKTLRVSPALIVQKAESEKKNLYYNYMYESAQQGVEINLKNPDGYVVESREINKTVSDNSKVILDPELISDDRIRFNVSNTDGRETICVTYRFKNHEDINHIIIVEKTSNKIVDVGFQILDMNYNSGAYDGWSLGAGYRKEDVTVSYYDTEEQKVLHNPPTNVGKYRITLRYEKDGQIAEKTEEFEIKPKEVELRALDKQIQVGEPLPSLAAPVEGVDYEFVSGRPNKGESIGTIKMEYADIPDTNVVGRHEIQIGVLGNINENYSVKTQNAQLNIAPVSEFNIKVDGGQANMEKAQAGEKVTITAEEPSGKQFVRWKTESAGVVLDNAESAVTTFIMPSNNVEITAEFKEKEAERYEVKINGGHADVQKAQSGEKVTITAEEPSGEQFVRWKTESAGVVLDNAESAVTTFIMPLNNVEITAEFKEKEVSKEKAEGNSNSGNENKTEGEKKSDESPSTGDSNTFVAWGTAFLTSLAGIVVLLFRRRIR